MRKYSDPIDTSVSSFVKICINTHLADHLTLQDLASVGAVGQSKCCKLFAKYFSMSPMAFAGKCRLERSLELLRDSDLSITEVALACGFGSGSYYTESFRKWCDKTPREYRKEFGNRY